MTANAFTCRQCGAAFSIDSRVVARYRNWVPSLCSGCRAPSRASAPATPPRALATFRAGPMTGVFTDGSCDPNPGPGGWGAVMVIDGAVVDERSGRSPATTNNRMELIALIEGFKLLEPRYPLPLTVYSDSQYCVRTINEWAAGWERKGWTKKTGEIKNLDLVRELYALARERPGVTLEWIRGHAGGTWNEYADALARKAATVAP